MAMLTRVALGLLLILLLPVIAAVLAAALISIMLGALFQQQLPRLPAAGTVPAASTRRRDNAPLP